MRTIEQMDEMDVRNWFARADLQQVLDTFRVVEGILQVRREAQPTRKRRSDAGQKRTEDDPQLEARKLFESTQG